MCKHVIPEKAHLSEVMAERSCPSDYRSAVLHFGGSVVESRVRILGDGPIRQLNRNSVLLFFASHGYLPQNYMPFVIDFVA